MAAVVTLSGDYDIMNAGELRSVLDAALAAADDARIAVDMAGVTFIDTGGWRILRNAGRDARQRGGEVEICRLSPYQRQIVEILGFDQLFTIRS